MLCDVTQKLSMFCVVMPTPPPGFGAPEQVMGGAY